MQNAENILQTLETIVTVAERHFMTLSPRDILVLAKELADPVDTLTQYQHEPTHANLVLLAKDTPAVMAELPDRKIQAIKALRAIALCGLKEAKDAVDQIVTDM